MKTNNCLGFNFGLDRQDTFLLRVSVNFLPTSKEGNKAFPPQPPPWEVVPLFELPVGNNKHPNFEWRGDRRGVDCFVLQRYPI